ncbi:MAG: hypothetical protein H0X46_04100 [Bacteroidetes bacterium]|nr:hypothetical protein [Bacteroidota bacterium]
MRTLNFTISLCTAALLLTSCSTTLYVPNTVNVPLLKEKGEIKLNIDQNNLQAAVAVSEHVGVMVNGFYRDHIGSNSYQHKGALGEIGVGYFKPLDDDPFVLEAFVGAGVGNVSKSEVLTNGNESRTATFDARATKVFIQPELGYTSRFFDLALSPRFSMIKFSDFNSSNYTEGELANDYLDKGRLTSNPYLFAEPAVTMRIGYKWLKLQAQYGMVVNIGGGQIRHPQNYSSLGLTVDIAKWYHK